MLGRLFGNVKSAKPSLADATYEKIVAAARQPELYSQIGIPDTPIGRFESISIHMVLYLRRSKTAGDASEPLAQAVTEEFFKDVDYALRELGIGDTSVPKRMKKLAKMFYGRAASYTSALDDADMNALSAALTRNITPDSEKWQNSDTLADYVFDTANHLQGQRDQSIVDGSFSFRAASSSRGLSYYG